MAKKLGNDYRLWIVASDGTTFSEVKGQTALSITRQGGLFDTSTKDDGAYATQGPGLKGVSISCTIFPNLPDTTGYTRLETVALASPAVANLFQVRKGGSSATGTDVVFAASLYVSNFNTEAPKNGPVQVTFELGLAAAPTTDLLA